MTSQTLESLIVRCWSGFANDEFPALGRLNVPNNPIQSKPVQLNTNSGLTMLDANKISPQLHARIAIETRLIHDVIAEDQQETGSTYNSYTLEEYSYENNQNQTN